MGREVTKGMKVHMGTLVRVPRMLMPKENEPSPKDIDWEAIDMARRIRQVELKK